MTNLSAYSVSLNFNDYALSLIASTKFWYYSFWIDKSNFLPGLASGTTATLSSKDAKDSEKLLFSTNFLYSSVLFNSE